MGEARQKRLAACRCPSGRPAELCCLTDNGWFRNPSVVQLRSADGRRHDGCYLKEAGGCSDKISGEHLVSESVLRKLGDKGVRVSGLPWLEKGESKALGFQALTANCLCRQHNSALSVLDQAGAEFFESFKQCTSGEGPSARHYLLSGHDVERWMLKSIAAMSASGNLARNRQRLTEGFEAQIDTVSLLEDHQAWRKPTGLYFTGVLGQVTNHDEILDIGPLMNVENDRVVGLTAKLFGFSFALLAHERSVSDTFLADKTYRPRKFNFELSSGTHTIELTWAEADRSSTSDFNISFRR